MTKSTRHWDPWAAPTLGLWYVFLVAGLFPEAVFYVLRDAGNVVTQTAMVNSPWVITVAFASYFAYFAFHAALDGGANRHAAEGRAVQTGLIAMVAFLPLGIGLILETQLMLNPVDRMIVYIVLPPKLLAWLYLLGLIMRFYIAGNREVFARMWCVFPSAKPSGDASAAPTGETDASPTPAPDQRQTPSAAPPDHSTAYSGK